jgi:endoglucanase
MAFKIRLLGIALWMSLMTAAPARTPGNWPLWEDYVAAFMGPEGRIIDHDSRDRTTSEGQSYALFFSLVANDRVRFNKLLAWTERNLAQDDLTAHLPAWIWEKKDGAGQVVDTNSASDADLWIAFTLLEAGRIWNDQRLRDTGRALASNIAELEVTDIPAFGKTLLPGPSGFKTRDGFYELNASYLPVQLLLALQHHLPGGPWAEIAAGVPALLRGSSPGGFVLDWIAFRPGEGFSIFPSPSTRPLASYDAIRVYLWAGMLDDSSPYRKEIFEAVSGMSNYLKSHSVPPAEVMPSGEVKNASGNIGFTAAVLPLLSAMKLHAPLQQQLHQLASSKNPETGLYGGKPRYYDQNLALFSTGWYEERFRFDRHGLLQVSWK